ncbi:MAG: hypothetical protein ACI9FB_001333 [Candidatus Azotimanducaceae bacterium]|jgi:hypothetical protein
MEFISTAIGLLSMAILKMPEILKREQIVCGALKLFYKYGFNSTGVDKTITSAGVSKKTLYTISDQKMNWSWRLCGLGVRALDVI